MACLIKIITGSRNYKAQALKELKTYVPTKTCTWMFITAWLTTAKTWKQPGRWMDKQTVARPDNGLLFLDAKE